MCIIALAKAGRHITDRSIGLWKELLTSWGLCGWGIEGLTMRLSNKRTREYGQVNNLAHCRFSGQAFFTSRFVVQWFVSERLKKSVVPTAFWHLSLLGGTILLAYALNRRDPVFILGQLTGILIYLRNLHFIRGESRQTRTCARIS